MDYSVAKSRAFVKAKKQASNQELLKMYDHIFILRNEKIWKESWYYVDGEEFEAYKDAKFWVFAKHVLGVTRQWLFCMDEIMKLENGRDLFINHGRENMATYLNMSNSEQRVVLKMAIEYPASTFIYLINKAFPKRKRDRIKGAADSELQRLYNILKDEFKDLEEKYEICTSILANLREENSKLHKENEELKEILKDKTPKSSDSGPQK